MALTLRPPCCCRHAAANGVWTVDRLLCCERGVPNAEAKQPPGQAQSIPSFARMPFDQQQQQQQQQQQPSFPRSPPAHVQSQVKTSKTTLRFEAPSFVLAQSPNALGTVRQSWTPGQSPRVLTNSLSAPVQGRLSGQPPTRLYSFGPRRDDSCHGQGQGVHQPNRGQTKHQQCIGGGRDQYGHQREAVRWIQQPTHGGDSNHVTPREKDQSQGVGCNGRDEQSNCEARKDEGEGGRGGGCQEDDEYQQMSVHDIKKMFNKPDQKSNKALTRFKQQQQQQHKMRCPAEGIIVPGACYGLSDSRRSPEKPTTEVIHRGLPPSANDYHRKPFSPRPQAPYGQSLHETTAATTQQPTMSINKQGGGGGGAGAGAGGGGEEGVYSGIRQSVLPAKVQSSKTDQRKNEFDPNQSAVYKIRLDEEERRKTQPHRVNEEQKEAATRRTAPGQDQRQAVKPLLCGSRLTQLLERDAAQIAPYKDTPLSTYQEQTTPYQDQRTGYHEPPPPRSSYNHEPHQLLRVPPPPPPPPPPPSHGVPVARHFAGFNHTSATLPPTF